MAGSDNVLKNRVLRQDSARAVLRSLALVLLYCCVARGQTSDINERIQLAHGLFARGMYELALREYEACLQAFPDSGQRGLVLYWIGETQRQLGNLGAAEERYRAVRASAAAGPYSDKATLRLADVALQRQQPRQAADLLQELLQANPGEEVAAAAWYLLGLAQRDMGNPREAAAAFTRVKTQYPGSVYWSFALLELGRLLVENQVGSPPGQSEQEALECYELAAEKPASERVGAEALFQLAELLFRRCEYDRSAEAYARLLSRYPADQRSAQARLQAAWAAHNAGRYADALRQVTNRLNTAQGTTNAAEEAEWLYLKANTLRQMNANDEALQAYEELLRRFPKCRVAEAAHYEKALVLYRLRRFADAVAVLQARSPWPELRQDTYWLLAEAYAGMQDFDHALSYYRRLLEEFPQAPVAPEAAYRLAYRLEARKEYPDAARYYSLVATNWPDHHLAPMAGLAWGLCHARDGRDAEAVEAWSRMLEKHGASLVAEDTWFQKAHSEMRLNRERDALASLQTLLEKFPRSPLAAEAHYWQGILFKNQQAWDKAEAALREALRRGLREEVATEARFHLANVLLKTDRQAEAARLLLGLLDAPSSSRIPAALLAWLAEYTYEQGQAQESARAARKLLENSVQPTWQQMAWGLLGRAEATAGNRMEAVEALRNCLAIEATTRFAAEAALQLGELMWSAQDYTNAAACFSQAASLARTDGQIGVRARAYAGLGRSARERGDFENAARYFMSVAILYDDPELVPECLHEAALAFRRCGRETEALKALRELRERYPDSGWARDSAR